ncbi:MAG: methyl-viologen-reducing hydrogenase delta subunit [Peptococcaceae bacterium]|nr:methyl-viologen-reducing hydrogenase delta subunit [Peptococcaceae bacterium]
MSKTGVIMCRCNGLNDSINFPAIVSKLAGRKEQIPAKIMVLACNPHSFTEIKNFVAEGDVSRLVIAACPSYLKGSYFLHLAHELGIAEQYVELINIREHCAWSLPDELEATERAVNLINMAIEKLKKVKDLGHWQAGKAFINRNKCDKCKRCVDECPNKAIELDGQGYPEVTSKCQRCGVCLGGCPLGVISLPAFRLEEVSAMLGPVSKVKETPVAVGFFCPHACEEADLSVNHGYGYPRNLYVIPVPCTGAVNMILVNDALSMGIDGVVVGGCENSQCQNKKGNEYALRRIKNQQQTMEEMFLEKERLTYMSFGEQYLPTAIIHTDKCSRCQECVSVCPFGAIHYSEVTDTVQVQKKKCRCCGTCASSCRSGAIQLPVTSDREILASIDLLASSGW